MPREYYTTEQVLLELTQEFEVSDGVQPGIESQRIYGEDLSNSSSSESESDRDSNNLPQCSRKRNHLTKSHRLVRNLNSALCPDNYDEIPAVDSIKQYTGFLEKPSSNAKTISWVNTKRIAVGRQPRASVILENPGPIGVAASAMSCLHAWELFFSQSMLDCIVNCTNKRIEAARQAFKNVSPSLMSFTKDTDDVEVRAFIGLSYIRGFAGMNNHDVSHLYDPIMGPDPFGATMSKNRLQFLYACLSFDDFSTRKERWKYDRFAAIRHLFESFNKNCSTCVVPEEYLCIDETLYPTRNKISFKQYNPNKPAKYGLLFKSINSVTYAYTHCIIPYCGKPKEEPAEYYVKGVEETVKRLVQNLQKYVDLQGRNISFDRLYTSITLAQWLLTHNITCVGTLQANRRGIPNEIKSLAERDQNSYQCFWESSENKLVLHSYVVSTKSSGKRNVLLLSTVQPILGVTKDDGKRKPAIYKLYDYTKGGTDVMDQRIGSFTCKAKSNRWTLTAFAFILDVCRVNASTVLAINKKIDPNHQNSYDFGMDLALSLIRPHVERRPLTGLQRNIKKKMSLLLGKDIELEAFQEHSRPDCSMIVLNPKKNDRISRCTQCLKETAGPGYRQKVHNMSKSRNQCQICTQATCSNHTAQMCMECFRSLQHKHSEQ